MAKKVEIIFEVKNFADVTAAANKITDSLHGVADEAKNVDKNLIIISKDTEKASVAFENTSVQAGKLTDKLYKLPTTTNQVSSSLAKTAVEAGKLDSKLLQTSRASNTATQSLVNLGRVAQDAPFGFIGIANNINPLLESFQRLKAESGSTKTALKALGGSLLGAGGLGLAVSVASSLLVVFGDKLFSSTKQIDDAANAATKYRDAVKGIFDGQGKEATQVISLIAVLKSELETRERKLGALKELNKINPEIFKGLQLEGSIVTGLDAAYTKYIENIKNVVAAKIIQLRLEQEVTKLLELQGATQSKATKDLLDLSKRLNNQKSKELIAGGGVELARQLDALTTFVDRNNVSKIAAANKEIAFLTGELSKLSSAIKIDTNISKSNVFTKLKEDIDKLNRSILDIKRNITEEFLQLLYGDRKPIIPDFIKPLGLTAEVTVTPKFLLDQEKAKALGAELTAFFKGLAEEIAISFGDALGNALSGTGSIKNIFQSIFAVVGAGLQKLGAIFIKSAVLIKNIEKFLIKNPALAIAGGIALIALGSILKNVSAFAVGTRNAPGGLSLVGERGPELINIPRGAQVVPAAQTANMLGGLQAIEVYGMVRGSDIYFSNKRFGGTLSRNT